MSKYQERFEQLYKEAKRIEVNPTKFARIWASTNIRANNTYKKFMREWEAFVENKANEEEA